MKEVFFTYDFRKDLLLPEKSLFVNQTRYWAATDPADVDEELRNDHFRGYDTLGWYLQEWQDEYPSDFDGFRERIGKLYNAKQVWTVFPHAHDVYDVVADIILNHHPDEEYIWNYWWADRRGWDCRLCFILFEKVLYLITMNDLSKNYEEPTGEIMTDDEIYTARRLRKLNLLIS